MSNGHGSLLASGLPRVVVSMALTVMLFGDVITTNVEVTNNPEAERALDFVREGFHPER